MLHLFARSFANFDKSQSLLKRSNPIIHIIHDQLFSTTCVLLSRFATPDIVKQYKQGETVAEITELIQDPDNLLAQHIS